MFFTGRFAMGPSHLENIFLPAGLRWYLLTLKLLYLQICNGTFSPAKFFTCSIGMAPSHLYFYQQICDGTFSRAKFFTCRFVMPPSHLPNFITARFAMAPSHQHFFFPANLSHGRCPRKML